MTRLRFALAALALAGVGPARTRPAGVDAAAARGHAGAASGDAASGDAVRIAAARCAASGSGDGDAAIRPAWQGGAVQRAEFTIRLGTKGTGSGGLLNRVIALHIDPRRVRLSLDVATRRGALAPWSVDDAPADALVAFNAGQFTDEGPWGWVVHRGREWQAPGSGSLAGAFVIDSAGNARLVAAHEIQGARGSGAIVEAVQSYPMLVERDAAVPSALCDAAGGIDLTHRDSRLAIGVTTDGMVLVVLTRYAIAGTVSRVPIGPTTPEMASLMQRLGAQRAMLLDGGLSAQLVSRSGADVQRWPGVRKVPLAIVGRSVAGRDAVASH